MIRVITVDAVLHILNNRLVDDRVGDMRHKNVIPGQETLNTSNQQIKSATINQMFLWLAQNTVTMYHLAGISRHWCVLLFQNESELSDKLRSDLNFKAEQLKSQVILDSGPVKTRNTKKSGSK